MWSCICWQEEFCIKKLLSNERSPFANLADSTLQAAEFNPARLQVSTPGVSATAASAELLPSEDRNLGDQNISCKVKDTID